MDIVCECDKHTNGRTYNDDFTRCTVKILITTLGVAIADGEAIYTIYVHATVLL